MLASVGMAEPACQAYYYDPFQALATEQGAREREQQKAVGLAEAAFQA